MAAAGVVTLTVFVVRMVWRSGMVRAVSYKSHRFPPELIAHAVWLYFRFPPSLRLVEEMLSQRGIIALYETIRHCGKKFGPDYTRRLRRKLPRPDDIRRLDEVMINIAGKTHGLWRAVDQDGYVLDEIVQTWRHTEAAKRVLTRLLKTQGIAPKRMIIDQLRSYGAARQQVVSAVEHRAYKGLNNRAEQPFSAFKWQPPQIGRFIIALTHPRPALVTSGGSLIEDQCSSLKQLPFA